MSEDSEMWSRIKEERRQKRWNNFASSLKNLDAAKIPYRVLDEGTGHVRVGEYDFWPTTGKFWHRQSGAKGRGVSNLIRKIKQSYARHN